MIATGKRNIRDGFEFDRFFDHKPKGDFVTVKKDGATLSDTLNLMKQVIRDTLDDTKKIAKKLQAESVKLTCSRIWNFCFHHFQYEKDEERKEQVRRPSRSWKDRKAGIDCDCLTVFIGSILTNLGIPFKMRMTRYEAIDFEHIYPVAESPNGEVIIDCVVHKFNYEVPYKQKKDIEMELQYLNGVEGERYNEFGDKVHFEHDLPIDAEDLFLDEMELQGLEGKAEREARKRKRKAKREERRKIPLKTRLREGLRKGFHVINKINPGAVLLRGGILASLKLNVFKVASHLRFAYWTEAEARKNQMDIGKFHQLQRIRQKIEKIYFGAGGKAGALKKAILTGKGNRNKMVQLNGLGSIISAVHDEDDLQTILGDDLFYGELNGFEGLDGFGEPASVATGAAITAASGVMGTIAALIKKLGNLFKKGSKSGEKFKIQDNTDNAEERTRKFSFKNMFQTIKRKIQERKERKRSGTTEEVDPLTEDVSVDPVDEMSTEEFDEMDFPTDTRTKSADTGDSDGTGEDSEKKGGIVQWVKDHPVPSALIGLGVVGGTILTVHLIKKNKAKKGLSGAPKSKKKKSKTKTKKSSKRTSAKKFVPRSRGRKKKPATKKRTSRVSKVELL